MEIREALDIIAQGRRLIEDWVGQAAIPDTGDGSAIKDRDVTRCLRDLRDAARHAPPHEAAVVAKIVELAETRLNAGAR